MIEELITQTLKWILPFIHSDFAILAWHRSGTSFLKTILFLTIISNSLIFLKYNSLSLFLDSFLGFWKKRPKLTRHPSLFSRLIEKYFSWEEKNIIQAEKRGKDLVKSSFHHHYPYLFLCVLAVVPFVLYLNTVIVVAAKIIKKRYKYSIYFILLGNTLKLIFLAGGIYYLKNVIYLLNNLFS